MRIFNKFLGIASPYPTKRLEVIRYKIPIKDHGLVVARIEDSCVSKIFSVDIEPVGSGCFDPFGGNGNVFENKCFDKARY